MRFQKIRVSKDVENRFRLLKGATGLTPNLICRFAFTYSIEDPRMLVPEQYDQDGAELNRATLTGDQDDIMIGLLRERCHRDGLDIDDNALMVQHLIGHINRGIMAMSSNIKNIEDLVTLAPKPLIAKPAK